jgi:hypothetical protein
MCFPILKLLRAGLDAELLRRTSRLECEIDLLWGERSCLAGHLNSKCHNG